MSLAIRSTDKCLFGVLDKSDKVIQAFSDDELHQLMLTHPDSILFFNQDPQSTQLAEQLDRSVEHKIIEVFQETVGVFGLRAFLQQDNIQTQVILALDDD